MAETALWCRKVMNTMAYIFLDDSEKRHMMDTVLSDMVQRDTMTRCSKCEHLYFTSREGCTQCGNVFGVRQPLTAQRFIDEYEIHIASFESVWGKNYILEFPWDAWIETVHNTITVKLNSGYVTKALPDTADMAFDLTKYLGRRRRKSRNRKNAVTAA